MAVSFPCMTKSTTIKKKERKKSNQPQDFEIYNVFLLFSTSFFNKMSIFIGIFVETYWKGETRNGNTLCPRLTQPGSSKGTFKLIQSVHTSYALA